MVRRIGPFVANLEQDDSDRRDASLMLIGPTLVANLDRIVSPGRIQALQSELLQSIHLRRVQGVVVSFERVTSIDRATIVAINQMLQAASVIGAKVFACGLKPYIAATIIENGHSLELATMVPNVDYAIRSLTDRPVVILSKAGSTAKRKRTA